MNRVVYLTALACVFALTACQNQENKIVSPPSGEQSTAREAPQPARLDTAMKSSQQSAAAVAQNSGTAATGMKEMAKQPETMMQSGQMQQQMQAKTAQTAPAPEPAPAKTAPAPAPVKTASAGGDATRGAALAKKRCSMCHNFDSTKRKVGPGLKGVYGRAPSIQGVPFSKWDAASLDKWLTNPKAVKKSTPMAFPGFKNKQDRDDVIAFLKTLK